jgi:3-hydroxyisobutyrate dehydrogenase-like beta-hydroxyacid dehydrogenase
MTMHHSIGFIGFGEAGFTIANGLRSAGAGSICAFDIASDSADRGPLIQDRAARSQTTLLGSPAELARDADIIFSTVTSSSAATAARQTVAFLEPRHCYADLNSVSPDLKREIESIVSASGARFVEVAVMAPVLPYGHRVPMLVNGPSAPLFIDTLAAYGMRIEALSGPIGTAAAVKMCRSIVVKGLEALLVECVLGAGRYGAAEHVFASLQESYPGIEWKKLADYNMGRVVVHGARRAREMEEVAETLRAAGVEPIMAEATARRQDWAATLSLRSHFGPDGPATYQEVLDLLATLAPAAGK